MGGGNAEVVRYIERESWDVTPNWRIDISTVYQVKESLFGWWSKIKDGEIPPKFEIEVEFTGKMKNYSSYDEFKKELSQVLTLVMENTSACY